MPVHAKNQAMKAAMRNWIIVATLLVSGIMKLGCEPVDKPIKPAAQKTIVPVAVQKTDAPSSETVHFNPDAHDRLSAKPKRITPSVLKDAKPKIPPSVIKKMACDRFSGEGQKTVCSDDVKVAIVRDDAVPAESAAFALMDDTRCIKFLGEYFGITLPEPSKSTFVHWLLAVEPGQASFSLGSEGGITTFKTVDGYERFLQFMKDNEALYAKQPCLNGHEMTHVFLGTTPVPLWANEGLASFVEHRITNNGLISNVTCTDNSWVLVGEEKPFEDLSKTYTSQNQSSWYNTGLCFWDYIEKQFGKEAVILIIQELKKYEGVPKDQVDFIRDIVNIVLGTDVTPVTKKRFNVP